MAHPPMDNLVFPFEGNNRPDSPPCLFVLGKPSDDGEDQPLDFLDARDSAKRSRSSSSSDDAPALFFRYRLTDPAGFALVNDELIHTTGYDATEYYANPDMLNVLTVPEDRPAIALLLRSDQDLLQPVVVRWIRRDRTRFTVTLAVRRIRNEAGDAVAIDVTGRTMPDMEERSDSSESVDDRLRATIDMCDDAIGFLRPQRDKNDELTDFVWDYANSATSRMFGAPSKSVAGSSIAATLPDAHRKELHEFLVGVLKSEAGSTAELHMRLKDHPTMIRATRHGNHLSIVVTRLEDPAGYLAHALAAVTDVILDPVTPLQPRLESVGDALLELGADFAMVLVKAGLTDQPMAIVRTGRSIQSLNDAAANWMGAQSGDVEGIDDSTPFQDFMVQTSSTESSREQEIIDRKMLEFINQAGTSSLHAVPLRGVNEEIGTIIFGTCLPEPALDQTSLRLALMLVRLVADLIEISELKREMLSSSRTREEFMSMVAHEIKTPLTGIRGYSQLLERYMFRDEPEIDRARRAVNGLQTQIDRILILANDLLDATRVNQGRLELRLEKSSVASIARDATERVYTASGSPGRRIVVDVPQSLCGEWDAARIDQVLFILLSNSVSYSTQGEIRVSARQEGDDIVITVSDKGIGIEDEDVERLFEPFGRGRRAQTLAEGTGLGLYVAREIVRQHNGQITIRSRPDDGTTVTVQLPMRSSPTAKSNSA